MKWLGLLSFAILTLHSCNTTPPPVQPDLASQNKQLIEKYFTLFNKHAWSEMAKLYTESADIKDPSLGTEMVRQTRLQIMEKYTDLRNQFPDIADEVLHIYPSGDHHVTVEFISTATLPDGSKFRLPICTVFTIRNGLITQDFTYYDNSN